MSQQSESQEHQAGAQPADVHPNPVAQPSAQPASAHMQMRRLTILQWEASLPKKIAVTAVIMLALIAFVYACNIPNPNMILIAGLVFCSALYGYGGGIVAALIMLLYTLFFFSVDHSFVRFTTEGLQKVLVSLCGIVVDMLLVCGVKRTEMRAFRQVESLTQELHRENEQLHNVSLTDGLTQIRNRTALQLDVDSYVGHEVTVMMLDLNDFKIINDTRGHEEGDRVLQETARLLANAFGQTHCYRYGGDEFLVILPDVPVSEFRSRLDDAMETKPTLEVGDKITPVSFSTGHVRALLADRDELPNLIAEADERMYEQKRSRRRARSGGTIDVTGADGGVAGGAAGGATGSVSNAAIASACATCGTANTASTCAVCGTGSTTNCALNASAQHSAHSDTSAGPTKYTVKEMESYLRRMSGTYDLARMVDPIECRVLEIQADGSVKRSKRCYGVWNSGQRCIECSSTTACKTGRQQHKAERVDDVICHMESNPIKLTLQDGTTYDAVVELGSTTKAQVGDHANDRTAENVDQRAALYRARHDTLTGVLNPDVFHELARERVADEPNVPWAMIAADIKNFRVVNSLFGVPQGNEVLVRTASLLNQIADDADGLCGRLGGDRFAVLVREEAFDEQSLQNVALNLARGLNDAAYKLCIHFGVYHIEDASLPVSVMCGRANSALYTIRESHAQTVAHFDDTIRQRILCEQRIISEFDDALANGEFQMYLQPLARGGEHVTESDSLRARQMPARTDGHATGRASLQARQPLAHNDGHATGSDPLQARQPLEHNDGHVAGSGSLGARQFSERDSARVVGAEALVRWRKPDGTLVMPGDFIEILERAGLIQRLDVYIWELAVKQLSIWKNTGLKDLFISVNLSAKDFYSVDVYSVLTNLTRRYDVDNRRLRLEITESALLVEPDKSNATVAKLRDEGFLVEIDDFGKGYSSLSILKSIQADVLKIDMGFLREVEHNVRSGVILQAAIDLARALQMDVICEGVETERQLQMLSSMGCGLFQGYYFSRPIPVAEFERGLASG